MAMLAEPRRKQRWTLNPRGKLWSEDTNKFGQKMLEKMGWSSGKGLGANEQGMTEHIRVAFKNDSSGIGFKHDAMETAWTEHQDGFNELLKELQKSQDSNESIVLDTAIDSLSGKSLELKSKQSRARVHYQKFTRGKDVNKYSSKDLANIFGQRDMNEIKDTKEKKMRTNSEENDSILPVGTEDRRNGVMTINRGSVSDYFKSKGSNFNKVSETIDPNNLVDSEEEPPYAGFGFSSSENKNQSDNKDHNSGAVYGFVNPCLKLDSPEDISSPSKKLKSSKKQKSKSKFYDEEPSLEDHSKKSMEDLNVDHDYTNGIVNPALNLTNPPEEVCNGQEYEVSRAQFGMTNSAFDPEDETSSKRRVTFNDHVEYSTDPIKKKTGKVRLDKFEVENKKCKRKRKHEESTNYSLANGIVNEALNVDDKPVEEQDNEINEIKCRKPKRRRESRPSLLETIEEIPEEDKRTDAEELTAQLNISSDSIVVLYDGNLVENVKKKKKKKKDKSKKNDAPVENDVSFQTVEVEPCDTTVTIQEENEVEIQENSSKIKKKKRKHKYQENAEKTSDATNAEQSPSENCETTPKQKKNKKGKKQEKEEANDEVGKKLPSDKEVSDKENTDNGEDHIKEKKKKKKDKKAKSVDKLVENDSPSCIGRIINESKVEEEEESSSNLQSKPDDTPSKRISSPWNERPRMSKKLLKSLFHRNAISNFPGSNIYDIKGYGSSLW